MTKDKKHGGSREGAGRKKLPDELRKVPVSYRLPHWLVLWLKEQDTPASQLIETALTKTFKAE